ncbi:hypothetical protein [Aeromonas sobria]|nr:hypothetical protein [Aeromonas sobria]
MALSHARAAEGVTRPGFSAPLRPLRLYGWQVVRQDPLAYLAEPQG